MWVEKVPIFEPLTIVQAELIFVTKKVVATLIFIYNFGISHTHLLHKPHPFSMLILLFRKLVLFDDWSDVAVHVAMDNTVVMEDISKIWSAFASMCYLCLYLLIYLFTYLLIYLFTYLLIYLFTYLLIYLFTYLFTYLLIYLFTYLLIYLFTYLLIYLFTYLLIYTDTALSYLTDKGLYTGMILIDLQKAFDTIDQNIFLQKLKSIGFSEKTIAWYRSCRW